MSNGLLIKLELFNLFRKTLSTHTHTHTYIYIYIICTNAYKLVLIIDNIKINIRI